MARPTNTPADKAYEYDSASDTEAITALQTETEPPTSKPASTRAQRRLTYEVGTPGSAPEFETFIKSKKAADVTTISKEDLFIAAQQGRQTILE